MILRRDTMANISRSREDVARHYNENTFKVPSPASTAVPAMHDADTIGGRSVEAYSKLTISG